MIIWINVNNKFIYLILMTSKKVIEIPLQFAVRQNVTTCDDEERRPIGNGLFDNKLVFIGKVGDRVESL